MADRTIWRGQSVNFTIGTIQDATNGHISKYVFSNGSTDLAGTSEQNKATTTIEAQGSVDRIKDYTITSYLLYSHNFAGTNTTATSNKVDKVLAVKEPLDATSLVKITPVNTGNYHDWTWSNSSNATWRITPTFADKKPYSKQGTWVPSAIDKSKPIGYVTAPAEAADIDTSNTVTWHKTTGASTDLGASQQTITIKAKSTTYSAPNAVEINRSASFNVRNAVTALGGLSSGETFARATQTISQTVSFTPVAPYSKFVELVSADSNQTVSNNSITIDGAVLTLSGQTITLNAQGATNTQNRVFRFKIRSEQGASPVETDVISFTVKAVADITGESIVEGESKTIAAGIGTITHVDVTTGKDAVSATFNGGSVNIKGLAVDTDTNWSITVKNGQGTTITISGKTTYLADVSASINTGDFIIVGTDTLSGLGAKISKIVTTPGNGTATLTTDGKLKYEASTKDGFITAGTYAIKVEGANGATRTINIAVRDITVSIS